MKPLLLLFLSFPLQAQVKIYQQYLHITRVEQDTVIQEYRLVMLGTKNRTDICFSVDYIFCYRELKPASKMPDNELIYIGKSEQGDTYAIRQAKNSEGFSIWITNLSKGFPHWYMSTIEPEKGELTLNKQ